jgi:hypothetical protein
VFKRIACSRAGKDSGVPRKQPLLSGAEGLGTSQLPAIAQGDETFDIRSLLTPIGLF